MPCQSSAAALPTPIVRPARPGLRRPHQPEPPPPLRPEAGSMERWLDLNA
jgi:hypothetical protein